MKLARQKPNHVIYKADPERSSGRSPARHAAKHGLFGGSSRKNSRAKEKSVENVPPVRETPVPVPVEEKPAVQQAPSMQPTASAAAAPTVSAAPVAPTVRPAAPETPAPATGPEEAASVQPPVQKDAARDPETELELKLEPEQPVAAPAESQPSPRPEPVNADSRADGFSWQEMAPAAEQEQPADAPAQAEPEEEEPEKKALFRRKNRKDGHGKNTWAFKSFQEFLDRVLSIKFLYEIFREKLRTLFVVGVACTLLFMSVQTFTKSFTAGVTMSLNYEESVTGKTPNGARFSESEFLTQEYLEAILQATGLQDDLTTADLADCISITPTTSRIVTGEDDYYISSSYNLTFRLPWSLWGKITANDFLKEICRVYNQRFTADYRTNATSLDVSYDYSEMDYSEIGSYFQMMADRINNYLTVRNDQAGSYLSSTGQSYSAIKKQVQNLQGYTLAEYQSYIWENGVAKNNARCIDDINESIRTLRWSEKSDSEKSSVYMKILDDYNNKMVSSVLIPTYDNDGSFYMSRTKIGIDDLALKANDLLTSSVDAQKTITTNNSKIAALQEPTTAHELEVAQSMVDAITQQLKDIVSATRELDADCYAQRISSYLVFNTPYVSRMTRYSVKSSVVLAAGVCCVWYLAAVVRASSADQRKRRKNERE